MTFPNIRSEIIHRRTYSRPLNEEGTLFESLEETTDRIISHQKWLWERQLGRELNSEEFKELDELYDLFVNLKASPSGRTRWLGGTKVAKSREASQFNCSFVVAQSPVDFIDSFWLLLQGCGVGFKPKAGVLRGFHRPVTISYVESDASLEMDQRQQETTRIDEGDGHYRLIIGDSAEGWARSIGKLLTLPSQCRSLTLDFTNI